ncbi:hypothetical protein Tco_0914321 [Tanacetum coccineum]
MLDAFGASVISRRPSCPLSPSLLPGRFPEPELEAALSVTNLKAMTRSIAIRDWQVRPWFCMSLNTASLAVTYLSKSIFDTPCV